MRHLPHLGPAPVAQGKVRTLQADAAQRTRNSSTVAFARAG